MDKVLKQRLVGASILIALAVIFVPMLFDSDESQTQRDMDLDLPEAPEGDLEVRRLPLGDQSAPAREDSRAAPPDGAARPETGAGVVGDTGPAERLNRDPRPADNATDEPASDPEPAPVEPESSEPETSAAAEATDSDSGPDTRPEPEATEPEPDPEPETSAPAAQTDVPEASADGDWVVQVASFSDAATAREISDRLRSLGHDAVIDIIVRGEGRLHRIRTGPYAGRGEADRALAQINRTVDGVSPVVLSLSGADTGPAEGRWAVQVGSFASEDNADRLQARLRGLGFTAFIHREVSGGRAIWKVRVGPVMERGEAEDLLARVGDKAGIEGLVVAHP